MCSYSYKSTKGGEMKGKDVLLSEADDKVRPVFGYHDNRFEFPNLSHTEMTF
jgi:hypothetical protein